MAIRSSGHYRDSEAVAATPSSRSSAASEPGAAARVRRQAWDAAMSARPGELDLRIAPSLIDGVLPRSLRGGRLLSNGPGWTRFGRWTAHPFDGHGYLRAFEFMPDGACRLRARFIDTAVYRDEAARGRFSHRGFATNLEGVRWRNLGAGRPRNVANTTVTRWGERLIVGWEGGEPHAVDADSLDTLGLETFAGAIAGQTTLAHMRHDRARERLLLCSVAGRRKVTVTFREVDRDNRVQRTERAQFDGLLFAHDFAFTDNWYLLAGNPLRINGPEFAKVLLGGSTTLRALVADDSKPGVLHLMPRGGGEVRTVRLPGPAFVVHFGNAYECADGTVIVDACAFDRYDFGEEFGYGGPRTPFDPALPDRRAPQRLLRFTIPPGASTAQCHPLCAYGVDFPRFHPDHEGRDTPWLFGATRADVRHSDPFDSLIALDLHDSERPPALWTAPDGQFVGEPILVPDPEAVGGGHVLALLSDGVRERTTLAIFNAAKLAAGPLASVPLPLLPIAFHGDWDGAR